MKFNLVFLFESKDIIRKMQAKKIREGVWEFQDSGMNVPARIYASDKLFHGIEEGVFRQASNVAKLPGIQKASMVMPDAHYGYGFPIGGVAAFDMEKGVISPGGVGYDINCLTEDSKVMTEFGCFKKIKNFEDDFITVDTGNMLLKQSVFRLKSINLSSKIIENTKAIAFMKFKPKKEGIFEIKTESGFSIQATEDHPFLTKNGMVELKSLENGNDVAVSVFKGVEYEFSDGLIVEKIKNISDQCENELNKRGLLPLFENSFATPYLAKLLGYLIGDGIVYFSDNKGYVHAYGKKDDLEGMRTDIEKIGFTASVYKRERKHKIETQYGIKEFSSEAYELHVSSSSFARFLVELGMPLGIKTDIDFCVPDWIMNSKKWIKRLFLAGLFGTELSKPKTHTKTGFYSPIFSQNKNNDKGRKFFIQIMHLLEEFDVKVNKISERKEQKNKIGETKRLRLIISADEDNLLNLWQRIGFEYNEERQRLLEIAVLYILKKKRLTSKRKVIAEKTREYKKKGLKLKEVQELLCSEIANKRFIERCYYENSGQRLTLDFISFNDFVLEKKSELKEYGVIFDKIEGKKKINYENYVYDFTINETHNFIANNFIVSNCGVRLLTTNLNFNDLKPKLRILVDRLFDNVPSGVGSKGKLRISESELDDVSRIGARWAVEKGLGIEEDLKHMEENGSIKGADPGKVSGRAKERGRPQLGTLGAGNHFLEVQKVDKIFDTEIAKRFGITDRDQITVMVHCGSRGFGYQVADDYIRVMLNASQKYGIALPDKELACSPINSKEAMDYVSAMYCAVNYAFCNREIITHWVRKTFEEVFGRDCEIDLIYDVCHNIAKFEKHIVDGENRELCVHRKGATRAFSAGRIEIPETYRDVGQPVIIPGDMGRASYVLIGTEKAMEETWGSTCHGAGRLMSRHGALREVRGEDVKRQLEAKGEVIRATSPKVLAEEMPNAYKDIDEVIRSVELSGISRAIARVVPLGVAKG